MLYFLPLRTCVTVSMGMTTRPILSCNPKACTGDSNDSLTLRSKPEYAWMMYQRMFAFVGRVRSFANCSGVCAGCSPSAVPALTSCSVIDSLKLMLQDQVHGVADQKIDAPEVHPEQCHRDDDNYGRCLHLFARGGGYMTQLGTHIGQKALAARRPCLQLAEFVVVLVRCRC